MVSWACRTLALALVVMVAGIAIVDGVDGAMRWASDGIDKLVAQGTALEHSGVQCLVHHFRGRTIRMSTSFSGILTPELAGRLVGHAINELMTSHPASPLAGKHDSQAQVFYFSLETTFAIEKDNACVEA